METAVEWLIDELLSGKILMPSLIEQAKKMEKQQIVDAWRDGEYRNTGCGDGETYYDETFKTK